MVNSLVWLEIYVSVYLKSYLNIKMKVFRFYEVGSYGGSIKVFD